MMLSIMPQNASNGTSVVMTYMKYLQAYSFMFRACNALSIAHRSFPFMLRPMNAMIAYGTKTIHVNYVARR